MTQEEMPFGGALRVEPPPGSDAEVRARHEANRAGWNEGAQHYTNGLEDTIASLRAGRSNLHPVERRNLGDLHQYPFAIHLQCASGEDTLSLWLEGVQRVAGVDISDLHIENARRTSAALDAPAEWYRCDVLDTPHSLDGTADLVYTGRGALCWIQDLDAYAQVVARLLKPGAVYHVLDDHAINWLFDTEQETYIYSGASYFSYFESSVGWPSTYIGDTLDIPTDQMARKYESLWAPSAVFTALTRAGLRVETFGEHPDPYWNVFPNLRPELRGRVPLTFSMLARKTA
jgi:SAM-dependent methyltransferase